MDGLEKKERGTLLCKTDQVTPCFNAPVPFEKTDYVWRIALMIDSEIPFFEFSCNTEILKSLEEDGQVQKWIFQNVASQYNFWPLLRRTFVIIKNSEMSNRQQLLRKIFEMEAKNESMMELMFFLALQHLEETIIMASRLQRQQQ